MNNNTEIKENTDFTRTVFDAWVDFNMSMMKSSMDIARQYWSPGNCEKLFSTWTENMTVMTDKIMRSPGFTEQAWNTFKSTVGFQKYMDMMTRMTMKNLNLPSREEFDELSERISYLDDKLESIENLLVRRSEVGSRKSEV